MDVVIFGTGLNAKRTVGYLQRKYNILWYVDNNEKRVGSKIEGYMIKSPVSLKTYGGMVIVIAQNHVYEIVNQLYEMGICQSRIMTMFCIGAKDTYLMDVYPIEKTNYYICDQVLQQYDLLKRTEKNNTRKVLIFAKFYSVYTKQLVDNLHARYPDMELSILTSASETKDMIDNQSIAHIYYFETMQDLYNILCKLPQYDVAQLLWIEEIWVYFTEEIRAKFNRLNLCVGGSDFYRASRDDLMHKKKLIDVADNISAETTQTIEDFAGFYGIDIAKMKLIPFGLEVINHIDGIDVSQNRIRERFGIPLGKVIVTCGDNAIQAHQHLKLIECLKNVSKEIMDKVVFVFPMTYPSGRDEYINQVRQKLQEYSLPYRILTDFMDFDSMAQYALISDVMIHVQTTDQLSSSMLEEMYTGSVIIAGEWLPYKMLHDSNIYFLDAKSIEDAVNKAEMVVAHLDDYRARCAGNKEIIWKNHSWDSLISRWHELME